MYDERADIDHHRYEVGVVREKLRDFGVSDTGYDLAIDIGGGYGLHAPFLLDMASKLYVADRLDYVNAFGGNVAKAIADKFQRHDVVLDRDRFEFHHVDAQNLPYRDGLFDLVVSINAFEHIDDPEAAFREAIRVTRPGGMMVIQFDPIWNSPFGHHLPHLKLEPWQHLVNDDDQFQTQIRAAGASDYNLEAYRTEMNRLPFSFYRRLFTASNLDSFEKTNFETWAASPADEPHTSHPNYKALLARGYRPEELFVRGVRFVGRRRLQAAQSGGLITRLLQVRSTKATTSLQGKAMSIDLVAETERQRAAEAAAAKLAAARERLLRSANTSPLSANRPLSPPQTASGIFSGLMTPQEMVAQARVKSGHAFPLNAPFENFFRAWPLLGRRSVIAVIRESYLLINGREPTLDECEAYLKGAIESRLNSGELRYLVAFNAGIGSPGNTLNWRQFALKVLGTLARRSIGTRGVPLRFSAAELAFDAFLLDAMRLTTALMTGAGEQNSGPRT